jgi:hypothetical protein
MTKWDTIQSAVADMYVGLEETLAWEQAIADGDIVFGNYDDEEF